MKKLGVLVMALVFILSASVYSFADERVEFNGEFRTRAWMDQNPDYNDDVDNDEYFWDQRFRLPVTFNISEAVSAHLRMDFSEGTWGNNAGFSDGWNGWATPVDELEVDRAYIQIAQDMYTLQVGQHWNGVGNYIVWDQQSTGMTLNLDLPVNITLNYSKVDETSNGTNANFLTDEDDLNSEDKDFYGVNFGYDQDMWNINALFAMQNDYSDNDQSPYAIGVYGAVALDLLTFSAEIDIFGGDDGNNDYTGTQGFLDVTYNMNDQFDVGASFLYAAGNDKADENQIQNIRAGAGTYTPLGFQGKLIWAYYPASYGWSKETGVFDFTGSDGGVVGGTLHADASFMEKFDAYLRVGYLTPEEDKNTNMDSLTTAFGNVDYQWLPSTTLSAGLGARMPDYDDNTPDDTNFIGVAQIRVDW